MMGDKFVIFTILRDPGADSGGEGKSKVLASDWCQETCVFLAPIRSHNGGDRLELVW